MVNSGDGRLGSGQMSGEDWDKQADVWDKRMGDEGNDFHLQLIRPETERLLCLKAGERVLDLGCGNGITARRLGRLGAVVTAVDVSEAMLDKARARTIESDGQVVYKKSNATSSAELLAIDLDGFDAVVCNMTLMDISEIEPLATCLPKMLRPKGRFVFSVAHPCFNNATGTSRVVEEVRDETGVHRKRAIKVSSYITPVAEKSTGISGTGSVFTFHRPLFDLLGVFFNAGMVMDGIAEPVFPDLKGERELGQGLFTEIPWAFVGRMRLGA